MALSAQAQKARAPIEEVRTNLRAAGQPERYEAIDGLRGISVLLVCYCHYFQWMFPGQPTSWAMTKIIVPSASKGWMGLHVFFVLSGFLITKALLHSKDRPSYIRNFYVNRAYRIFPAYYATLLALWALIGSKPYLAFSAFFLSDAAELFTKDIAYPFLWTLSVEQHYYFIWPWLVRAFQPKRLARICVGVLVAMPVLRGLGRIYGWEGTFIWANVDGLALGSWLAIQYFSLEGAAGLRRIASLCLGAGILGLAAGTPFGVLSRETLVGQSLQLTFLVLTFTGATAASLLPGSSLYKRLLCTRPLKFFGDISYSLYLLHAIPLLFLPADWFGLSAVLPRGLHPDLAGIAVQLVRFTLGVGLSYASYRWIELTFLRLNPLKKVAA